KAISPCGSCCPPRGSLISLLPFLSCPIPVSSLFQFVHIDYNPHNSVLTAVFLFPPFESFASFHFMFPHSFVFSLSSPDSIVASAAVDSVRGGPSSSSTPSHNLHPIRSSNRLAAKGPMVSLATTLLESRRISGRKPIPRRRYISAPSQEEGRSWIVRRSTKTPSPPSTIKTSVLPKNFNLSTSSKNQRQSPSMESGDMGRYADSPYNQELDDLIIDEILSLEDEQRRSSSKPMTVSYSGGDHITGMHSSQTRPIPLNKQSPGGSGHSGSPSGLSSSFNRHNVSSSAPATSFDLDKMVRSQTNTNSGTSGEPEDQYRDRRKKDIHNMIERRRRYNINDRIKELGLMLPKHSAEDMKLNKGTILKASCEYIRQLQRDRDVMSRQAQTQSKLEDTARAYADRVKELEDQLAKNGISIPERSLPPLPITIGRPIKQEPNDDTSPSQTTPSGSLTNGYLSQIADSTAAMQITSPLSSLARSMPNESFFSVGSSASPPNDPFGWNNRHNHFSDLIMEDMGGQGPLLNDPLMSAGGPSPHLASSQMSPDIHWDHSGFSPDTNLHQQHGMDYS
ncbi:hypothetical protein PFISCL1PPCAC_15650, partial [Pristionchus fissidentatus]